MKEKFVNKKFGPEATALLDQIIAIVDDYQGQGYDLSLRQLYYQLVSKGVIENTIRSYKNIGNLVSDARYAGLLDWDMIKDRGRETSARSHWENARDFVTNTAPACCLDLWLGQENHVEVMCEKDALSGVLEPVCRSLDVPFTANRGYSSSSAMYETSKRLLRKLSDEGRPVHIIYLGDHDPSGIDMTRDVEDRLKEFARCTEGDTINITVHRIALNMDQVRKYRPPNNPAKITDSRAEKYIELFGSDSWELDALDAKLLDRLVRAAVTALMDVKLFNDRVEQEKSVRAQLIAAARKFK